MDERGAWVEEGSLKSGEDAGGRILRMETFIRNVETLSAVVGAK